MSYTANIVISAPDWRPLDNTWTGLNTFQSNLRITAATVASSTGTGALQISAGGLGVNGAVYVGGAIVVQNTAESTATGTGSLQVSGGVGIKANLVVGGNISIGSSVKSSSYTDIIVDSVWGTTAFNFNSGTNYYMSTGTPAATTGTVNFTNLTATAGYSYTFTFVLPTTNPAFYYSGSTFQVNGGACTLKSNISTLPTPTAFIIQTFTFMYLSGTWYVITSALSF